MRAVIYARYSSHNQREASIDDQVEVCRRYIEAQGWHVTEVYSDRAISGATKHRPGYQQMIADAGQRRFDVIVCAALEAEKAQLQASAVTEPALVMRLHPGLAGLYAAKVAQLEEALNDPAIREEANGLFLR